MAVESYFYKLSELTDGDVLFIEQVISQSPIQARSVLTGFLDMFTVWHRIQALLAAQQHKNDELERLIETQIAKCEEEYHSKVESDILPMMKELRDGNIAVLDDDELCMQFCYYLAVQLFRTKGVKTRIIARLEGNSLYSAERCWNILSHICAANVGFGLFAARESNGIKLIKNETDNPFITGDQPLVNLLGTRLDGTSPKYLAIYYPISPEYALFIDDAGNPQRLEASTLSTEMVTYLNGKMVAVSHAQVFANTKEALEPYLNNQSNSPANSGSA